MRTEVEHPASDWRSGKSWKQIIEYTQTDSQEPQFRVWQQKYGGEIKVGGPLRNNVTEEIKEIYCRLLFAYKDTIAENPKKPGIIPGIQHRIVFNIPEEQVMPPRDGVRGGSREEEEVKQKEVSMLLENDIIEESNRGEKDGN